MKTGIRNLALLLLPALALSCKDKIEDTFTVNEPVYMSYTQLRNSFKVEDGQQIVQPGKIYFKDNYIFVNEYQKGIHVIDNTNPSLPRIIKFIEIPGNVDMAIKNNILYADSYVDLVAIDISNINDIKEVKRIENAFPYMIPSVTTGVADNVESDKGVVTGWRQVKKTEKVNDFENDWRYYPAWNDDMIYASSTNSYTGSSEGSKTGKSGSMARFALYENYLYTVDSYALRLFDVSVPENPEFQKELYVGWEIETIFPYEDKLFFGGQTGMFIYSLIDPSNPSFISLFNHASSCDPVVVDGDYAYVTLRAGNLCGDTQSQLDVIDLSDILNPTLKDEYPMTEPYGLGIDQDLLFVCDGNAGLKIYNDADPLSLQLIATYENINAFDVIALGDVLVMIGTDGLYQYDYSDPANIRKLSVIPIENLQFIAGK